MFEITEIIVSLAVNIISTIIYEKTKIKKNELENYVEALKPLLKKLEKENADISIQDKFLDTIENHKIVDKIVRYFFNPPINISENEQGFLMAEYSFLTTRLESKVKRNLSYNEEQFVRDFLGIIFDSTKKYIEEDPSLRNQYVQSQLLKNTQPTTNKAIQNENNEFQNYVDNMRDKEQVNQDFHYLNFSLTLTLRGRNCEIQYLKNFIEDSNKMLYCAICGDGGVGKSKLIHHFLENDCPDNWKKVYFSNDDLVNCMKKSNFTYNENLIIVFDYACVNASRIGDFLCKINNNDLQPSKLRVILIERQQMFVTKDLKNKYPLWFERFLGTGEKRYCLRNIAYEFDISKNCFLSIDGFDKNTAFDVMDDYAKHKEKDLSEIEKTKIWRHLEAITCKNEKPRPLYLLFVVDAHLSSLDYSNWDFNAILDNIIIRYRKNWINHFEKEDLATIFETLTTFATSTKELNLQYKSNDYVEPFRKKICEFLENDENATLPEHNERTIVHKLEPDIIGEFHVLNHLKKYVDYTKLEKICEAFWHTPNEFSEFINRCILDYFSDDNYNWGSILENPIWIVPSNINEIHLNCFKEIFKQLCINLSIVGYEYIKEWFDFLQKKYLNIKTNSVKSIYHFVFDLGMFCRENSLFELAHYWFEEGDELASNEKEKVEIYIEIGLVYVNEAEYLEAARIYEFTLEHYSNYLEEDKLNSLNLYSELIFSMPKMKEADFDSLYKASKSMSIKNKLIELIEFFKHNNTSDKIRNSLSNSYYVLSVYDYNIEKNFNSAAINCKKALALLKDTDDNYAERKSFYINMNAFIYRQNENYGEAVKSFEENLELRYKIYSSKKNTYVATAEMNLGRILTYNVHGREHEARELLNSALNTFKEKTPNSPSIKAIQEALQELTKN